MIDDLSICINVQRSTIAGVLIGNVCIRLYRFPESQKRIRSDLMLDTIPGLRNSYYYNATKT
jgi:hypothetical protein